MLHDITIRASSLSNYVDCPRRWAARHITGIVVATGFYPRSLPSSVGAVIGSGTHSAIAYDLEHKMRTGELAPFRDAEAAGIAELEERIEREGVMFDEVSQDISAAQMQVRRLARVYREDVGEKIDPIVVEDRMNVRHPTGLVVSGQIDALMDKPSALDDVKTGKTRRPNWAQYGTYSRLLRSHGYAISEIRERFIRRAPLTKEQPRVVSVAYDIDACETQAEQTIQRVARDVARFRATGDRETFAANPASALCGDKYCPAAHTSFCPFARKER